ncbi:MAG TPA: c-type cytochrome [Candidatus Sulfotelmatobacter sp.]
MKRFWRISLFMVASVAVILAVAVSATIGWRPFIGPRTRVLNDRKFEVTPERLVRGNYLANSVSGCMFCHSPHDWKAPGAPALEGKLGAGDVFPLDGLPGRIVAPNITPDAETGAGTWSDDQLARGIREGIAHDGRALFPLMPYENFRAMSDEDLASVVVYLRSLAPVRNSLPSTEIIFPVKYLIRSAPEPVETVVASLTHDTSAAYGTYLVRISGCADCHTPQQKGQPLPGLAFAGGSEFKGPFGTLTSANITPDPSGIGYYDEKIFFEVLRTGKVGVRALNPIMPWGMLRGMTDNDLHAMFADLHTLKPVRHRVDNTLPPTFCKICKGSHGAGDQN